MIRKEYHIESIGVRKKVNGKPENLVRDELYNLIDTALAQGAIVELKILEGVDLVNDGRRFSKIRMDIVSNTDFDNYAV